MTRIRRHQRPIGARVDVHVLVHHSRQHPEWLEQCLGSLRDQPVNVDLVYSEDANVGRLRALAFEAGRAPLVSFIDDDDWCAQGVFDACCDVLDADAGLVGVYTNWTSLRPDGSLQARELPEWAPLLQVHGHASILHTKVFRRAPVMELLAGLATWDTLEEAWLVAKLVESGRWRRLPINGHFKRVGFGGGAGSRITVQHLARYAAETSAILHRAHRRHHEAAA
ncbi:MAG: glycosyltransferase family A protein [Silanimonas sp.]